MYSRLLIPVASTLLLVLSACSYIPGLKPAPTPTPLATPKPTATLIPASPTPTPTATLVPPPPTASSTVTAMQPLQELLDDLGPRIAAFRELAPLREVISTFITTEQLRQQLEAAFDENYSEEEAQVDQEVFALLDLLPEDFALRSFLQDLYAEQVLGYYDTEEQQLYVRLDTTTLSPNDRLTYLHEYVHALQDQHFDLEALDDDTKGNADQGGALTALIEGDATLASLLYAQEEFSFDEYQQLFVTEPSPIFDSAPRLIQEDLLFPYVQGLDFVLSLLADGGWEAIDGAYADPPLSSEHILHPDRYFLGDDPQPVDIAWATEALDASWTTQATDTLGEFGLSLMLDTFLSSSVSQRAAQGWGGDRYVHLKDTEGRQTLVLSTTWDTQADSQEFFNFYVLFTGRKAEGAWPLLEPTERLKWWQAPSGRTVYVFHRDLEVLIILAPDALTAQTVAAAY